MREIISTDLGKTYSIEKPYMCGCYVVTVNHDNEDIEHELFKGSHDACEEYVRDMVELEHGRMYKVWM